MVYALQLCNRKFVGNAMLIGSLATSIMSLSCTLMVPVLSFYHQSSYGHYSQGSFRLLVEHEHMYFSKCVFEKHVHKLMAVATYLYLNTHIHTLATLPHTHTHTVVNTQFMSSQYVHITYLFFSACCRDLTTYICFAMVYIIVVL